MERPERTEQAHRAVAQALAVAPAEAPVAEAPAEAPITAIEDVTIRPIAPPKPSLFVEPADPVPEAAPALAEPERPFIPPQAERPALRPPRMPRIDELPIPAQNQIRARETQAAEPAPQKQRVSLLQRLASVGLGRKDEDETRAEPRPATRPVPGRRRAGRSADAEGSADAAAAARPRGAVRIGVGIRQASGCPAAGPARPRPARPAGSCE